MWVLLLLFYYYFRTALLEFIIKKKGWRDKGYIIHWLPSFIWQAGGGDSRPGWVEGKEQYGFCPEGGTLQGIPQWISSVTAQAWPLLVRSRKEAWALRSVLLKSLPLGRVVGWTGPMGFRVSALSRPRYWTAGNPQREPVPIKDRWARICLLCCFIPLSSLSWLRPSTVFFPPLHTM